MSSLAWFIGIILKYMCGVKTRELTRGEAWWWQHLAMEEFSTLAQKPLLDSWNEVNEGMTLDKDQCLEWPNQSHHLNPIENLWYDLNRAVNRRSPYSVIELEHFFQWPNGNMWQQSYSFHKIFLFVFWLNLFNIHCIVTE